MDYTVKELAELYGVTVRTLRWYHQIGLLSPAYTTAAGYRKYGPAQVDRLQQILFYRELDLPLEEIRQLLDDPAFDCQGALQSHLAALMARRARLDGLIATVQATLNSLKGVSVMTDTEKFDVFKQDAVKKYEEIHGAEARALYGDAAVDQANADLLALSHTDYNRWRDLGREILDGLARAVRAGEDPAGPEGQRLAGLHRQWGSFGSVPYDPKLHRGLAALYTEDPRFTAYYDREVCGCAAFLRAAVEAYTSMC